MTGERARFNRESMEITAENTADLRLKGLEARRIYKTSRVRLENMVREMQGRIEQIYTVMDKACLADPVIKAQLKQLDQAIQAETDPALLVRLVQAKATLYGLIHPKPGIAKPRRARAGLDLPPPKPVEQAKPGSVPGTV